MSTRLDVERLLVRGFWVVRAAFLGQVFVGVATGALAASTRPALNVACLIIVAVESLAVGVWLSRRGNLTHDPWPALADCCTGVLALAVVPLHTAPPQRLASWSIWAFPFTLSTAVVVGVAMRTLAGALLCSGALAVVYFAVAAVPSWGNETFVSAISANATAYLTFAGVAWLFTRVTGDLAELADQSRERVAELERERGRATVHDLLPFLRLEHVLDADGAARGVMIDQAEAKYRQMRVYVDDLGERQSLESCLRGVLELHQRLSCRAVFDLDTRAVVSPQALERLVRAVDTALANVEQNAAGSAVEVSAVCDLREVCVSVRDDGPGFDPALVAPGYGIGHILGHHLDEVGGHGSVVSAPGRGTEVTIVVPRQDQPR